MNQLELIEIASDKRTILNSKIVGCYHCFKHYALSKISSFVKNNNIPVCIHCGVDAVIGDFSGLPVTDEKFLQKMHLQRFYPIK